MIIKFLLLFFGIFLASCAVNDFSNNLREKNSTSKEWFIVEKIQKTTFELESMSLTVAKDGHKWYVFYVDNNIRRFESGERIKIRFIDLDTKTPRVKFLKEGDSGWDCCYEMMALFD